MSRVKVGVGGELSLLKASVTPSFGAELYPTIAGDLDTLVLKGTLALDTKVATLKGKLYLVAEFFIGKAKLTIAEFEGFRFPHHYEHSFTVPMNKLWSKL